MKIILKNSCLFIILLIGIACQEESNQNQEEAKEAKVAAINISGDTEEADFFLFFGNGSYILCDAENEKGYSVLYMNDSIGGSFDSGLTVFLDEKGIPVMASSSQGHFIFNNIRENCFDFAYINNQGEATFYNDVLFAFQTDSSTTRSFFDPWIESFKSPFGGVWDEHCKKAIVPFICKIASFAITAGDAVWGKGQLALIQTIADEIYKSSNYENKWLDRLFTGLGMKSLFESGFKIEQGEMVFTPKRWGLSALAAFLNKYADEELNKLGEYNEHVGPVLDPEEWRISLSTYTLECEPNDDTYSVDVKSKALWEIDDSQIDHEWCEVTKTDSQVVVHVKSYDQEYDRACNLIIQPKYQWGIVAISPVTLTIKQSGFVFKLSQEKLVFTQAGGSKGVIVTTNDKIKIWGIASYPSWCKVTPPGNYSFFVDVEKYLEGDRSGKITLTAITNGGIMIDRVLEVEQKFQLCPDDNHPHAIDLGLPSGTKWACCNVEGRWYAWGMTETQAWYNQGHYKYYDYQHSQCMNLGNDIAGTQYDAATVNWGAPWHMPSRAQMQELLDNCTPQQGYYGGYSGTFIGPNGNAIFLPFDMKGFNDFGIGGHCGCYWSSSIVNEGSSEYAYYLYISSNSAHMGATSRFDGCSIRPVR